MTSSASRAPTSRERENNKRRERRRRAIAARIFSGLRQFGNYKLPKHCDNNEVLKALCREAGWIVQEDGTTYKVGTRPPRSFPIDNLPSSSSPSEETASATEAKYKSVDPTSQTCNNTSVPAPPTDQKQVPCHGRGETSSYAYGDGMLPLLPWLKGLNKSSDVTALQIMRGGSFSAPVTPPLSSPRFEPSITADASGTDSHLCKGDSYICKPDAATEMACAKGKCDPSSDLSFCRGLNPDVGLLRGARSQKPYIASGTSTPTYPPFLPMSGTSTPSHLLHSGASTPGYSSVLPSGASTPTYASSHMSMRALPIQFATAISNLALICEDATKSPLDNQETQATGGSAQIASYSGLRKDVTTYNGSIVNNTVEPKAAATASNLSSMNGAQSLTHVSIAWPVQSADANHGQVMTLVDTVPESFKLNVGKNTQKRTMATLVKPWEGETIHEVSLGEEDLELTLGNSTTKSGLAGKTLIASTS